MPRRSSAVSQGSCRLYLLGSPRIAIQEQTIPLLASSAIALLGYLALLPRPGRTVTRSRLAGMLFPDETETHARRLLSENLYRLRRILGDYANQVLHADEELISLGPIWIDVDEFHAHISGDSLVDWRMGLDLYTGDLLEDLDTDWILGPRARLHELYLQVLEQTCLACLAANDLPTALHYAHQWTLADPLREEAHCTVIQLYARLGRHAAALQQFNHLRQILAEELQVEPLAETRSLAASIRAELEERAQPTQPHPFIGRHRERMALLHHLDKAQSDRSVLVLLEGEPGIGKTRLMEQVADSARWRHLNVAWGHGNHLQRTAPYAPLMEVLKTALGGPRADQVRARLSPSTVQALSWVFPHARSITSSPLSPEAKPDLIAALTECMRVIADLNPYIFILDDVQWASSSFWQVLPTLIEQTANSRLLWFISYRTDELRADSLAWDTLRALDRQTAPLKIVLGGLTASECAELASELGHSLDIREAEQWCEQTHGNPLFLREALTQNQPNATSFQAILEERLALLPVNARRALEAGAVLGREFTHARWQAIAEKDLLEVIPVLVKARLIQESEHGYMFEHDLTREYVYREIPSDPLQALHLSAAETLIRENARPGEIALHFEQAGVWPETICYYCGAGDFAMKTFAYTAALEHYTHALDLLSHLAQQDPARLVLLCRRQRALGLLLKMPEWRSDVDEIERLATRLNDPAAMLEALEASLSIQALDTNFERMQNMATLAMDLARRLGKPAIEARIARMMGRYLRIQFGSITRSVEYLERAVDLAESIHDLPLHASALCTLAASQVLLGQNNKAYTSAAQALAMIEQHPELHSLRPEALLQLANVSTARAEWESAYSMIQNVIQEQFALGKIDETGEAAYFFGMVCAEMGQFQEGLQTIEFILALATQLRIDTERSDTLLHFRILGVYLHLMAGDAVEAERGLEALSKFQTLIGPRSLLQTQLAWGWLRLEQGNPQAAIPFLARGLELVPPESIADRVKGLFAHALAAQQIGDIAVAQASLTSAEQILASSDTARYNVVLAYTRYRVYGRMQDLQTAHDEIKRQSALFTDERLRADFQRVYWNRLAETEWQALQAKPTRITVRLARADTALGKALTDADLVPVQWTVDDGASDADILEREGKVFLRLHRLQRLIAEAKSQGALPTDADLAHALGVAERTIERDIKTLAARGKPVATRRRKATAH